jgi:hypothetical protein
MSDRRPAHGQTIRASEIGEYLYCRRAWWLGRVLGRENANRAEMQAGIERHAAHGAKLKRADRMEKLSALFVLIALGGIGVLALRLLGLF